ncbi:MAG: autotransporter outer membrane beta-barrel domain-containing protein, partial [Xanthomonadaceae bacterium]|nr:autotransporter outer membrane beta-barrel domain-containing protein [Xanthomonadaceae bacterium]
GIRYNGNARVNYGFDRGWWDNGIGLTAEINERHSLYVDIGYTTGNKFDRAQLNLGYRLTF